MKDCQVQIFPQKPQAKSLTVSHGENLWNALEKEGILVPSQCGGVGSCGRCIVKILKGKDNLGPFTDLEKSFLGNVHFITGERLACQCFISGDVELEW